MADPPDSRDERWRSHLRLGWGTVFVFVVLGVALEMLHAFKADVYLGADQLTRRLMWRLAHAHGTLLGLLNLAFYATARELRFSVAGARAAPLGLRLARLLMPAGFFLGGLWLYGGDPGLGVLLVPLGGIALVVATALTARAAW